MRIAILVYEGFDELDVLGPYEVLSNASSAGAEVQVLLALSNSSMAHVTGSHGVAVIPHTTIYDGPFDIVVVPAAATTSTPVQAPTPRSCTARYPRLCRSYTPATVVLRRCAPGRCSSPLRDCFASVLQPHTTGPFKILRPKEHR
jgi:hypothetical protein